MFIFYDLCKIVHSMDVKMVSLINSISKCWNLYVLGNCSLICLHKNFLTSNMDSKTSEVTVVYLLEEWYWILGFFVFIGLAYYYLWLPKNWKKDLYSVGYGFLDPSNKELQASLLRRARKMGKLPPVFPNGWFAIAESDEVKPGTVIYRSALGENFAVFRSEKGICHVLDAYCPHVGANMAVGGRVFDDCLECPFHGWRFSGTSGKCVFLPFRDTIPKFLQVKRWIVHEVNDLIFIWYHAESAEPCWYPPGEQAIQSRKYTFRGRNEYLVNCHIQEIPENGGDLCHFSVVHGASLLAGNDLRYSEKKWLKFFRHIWSAEWNGALDKHNSHIAHAKMEHKIFLFGKFSVFTGQIEVFQYGPGYVTFTIETSLGTVLILQTVTPVEPLLQKIVHRIYCHPILFIYATLMLKAESIMVERDIMVWNHKKYLDNPFLLKIDKTIAKFRRWFSQFYSNNSPLLSDVNSMKW